MTWTFEATAAGYAKMWGSIAVKGGADATNADRFARKIIDAEARYKKTEAATGVPWFFIGALHMRESSCRFDGVLHNGERIIGTGRTTRLVPAGRGPFASWEEAAADALRLKNLHQVTNWTAARMGFEAERFNGLGYANRGVNSPYVWAGSNHEQRGKYVRDHVWDGGFDDPQIGVLTVIKRIAELRPDVAARLGGAAPPPVVKPAEGVGGVGAVAAGFAVNEIVGWVVLAAVVILAAVTVHRRVKERNRADVAAN